MNDAYTNEVKFYLTNAQRRALADLCEEGNISASSVARDAVMARIIMSKGQIATCADGRECIAPLIRLQTNSHPIGAQASPVV